MPLMKLTAILFALLAASTACSKKNQVQPKDPATAPAAVCKDSDPDCHGIEGPIPDCCCQLGADAPKFSTEQECTTAQGTCAADPQVCNAGQK